MTPMEPSQATTGARSPRCNPQQETERTILALLLSEPYPWTRAEIARELGGLEVEAHDGMASLIRSGLLNREGESMTASRAARAFEELEA